jgi:hypothetical protein
MDEFTHSILASIIVGVVVFGLILIFVYSYNVDISKKEINQCNELRNLGFKTDLEHNPALKWSSGKIGAVCYIYLEDGRRVIYNDIKNSVNVNFAKLQ